MSNTVHSSELQRLQVVNSWILRFISERLCTFPECLISLMCFIPADSSRNLNPRRFIYVFRLQFCFCCMHMKFAKAAIPSDSHISGMLMFKELHPYAATYPNRNCTRIGIIETNSLMCHVLCFNVSCAWSSLLITSFVSEFTGTH